MKSKAKVVWMLVANALMLFLSGAQFSLGAVGDENWDAQFGNPGANGPVKAMSVGGSGLLVGGRFSTIGGVEATNVASLKGSNWANLADGLSGGGFPNALSLVSFGGNLYAGGLFAQAGQQSASNIAEWNGTIWSPLDIGINGSVNALAASGSDLYAAGQFTTAGGLDALRIAKWNGTNWFAIGAITNSRPGCFDGCFDDGAVFALAASGTNLYVGGRFVFAGTVFATNIAKWNGAEWSPLGNGVDGQVWAICAKGSEIYAAGDFGKAGMVVSPAIARWDGNNWSSLGLGVTKSLGPPSIHALALIGSDIYAGGDFSTSAGAQANNIGKWDGAKWSSLGTGVNGAVTSLAGSGSELFVGGIFSSAGGIIANNLALWHIPLALHATRSADLLHLSWPATGTNFVVEFVETIGATNWAAVPQPFSIVNDQCVVTDAVGASNRFYRLRRN